MLTWWRMARVAARLAWPDLAAPWRSPLIRWRVETYGVTDATGRLLQAESIGPRHFFRFLRLRHRALRRFLRWAADLDRPL